MPIPPVPSQVENPKGFHGRYKVEHADGSPIDPNAVYFVLRIDKGGSDPVHVRACRKALKTYVVHTEGTHLDQLSIELDQFIVETGN